MTNSVADRDEMFALRLRHGPDVWRRLCRHLDGIAVGTTVAALAKAGALAALGRAGSPLDIDVLADAHGSPRGCFHLAMRLLEEQGWVVRNGAGAGGRSTAWMTEAGHEWLPHANSYVVCQTTLAVAQDLFTALVRGGDRGAPGMSVLCRELGGVGERVPERVRDQLWGPLAAAAASGLRRSGGSYSGGAAETAAYEVLTRLGWAERGGLTDAGRLAVEWAAQYDHSISYFPTFAAVGEMLFPAGDQDARASSDLDLHLDRRLDIDFSGVVFSRTCRDSFFEVALPLFDVEPVAAQPAAVIDTGAGDGSLLRELYIAIRDRTRRGAALMSHPLTMVGVEPSPVAREITTRAMAELGCHTVVVDGDIADPAAIAARLVSRGVDFAAALHVSKSVIHDRKFRQAGAEPDLTGLPWPASDAVFVAEDGGLITHIEMQRDLVGHFARWQKWSEQHGMIAIEVHTVPARLIAAHEGHNVMTGLSASHGYSRQYLVELSTYRRAAAEAGFVSAASRSLMAEMLGMPIMTIDHWRPGTPLCRSA